MIRKHLGGALLAGILAVNPLSQALAHPLGSASAASASIITVQGWGEGRRDYCWRLRNRAHELREQIYYAPPWERERMERHLWGVRERLRGECWGGRG